MYQALDPSPEAANARLARLDLRVEDLLLPVQAGAAARRTATLNHPRSYGGWRDYSERTAALRELLTRGWTAAEADGVCLTVHPQRRLALITAMGTAGTGTDEPVTTRRRRGEVTERVVHINAQLELDLQIAQPKPALTARPMPTWVLLVHADGDEVRSELSHAKNIEDGYIDAWFDRVALPVVRLNDTLRPGDDDGGSDHDFDVPEL